MSVAEHLDALVAYGAMAIRVEPIDGEPEDLVGSGGDLSEAFERIGRGPLLGVLRDTAVRSVLLADADLRIEVERSAAGARLRVAWGDQVVVDEDVEVPVAEPLRADVLFRPDPSTRVEQLEEAFRQLDTPLCAVMDLGREVRWYRGGLHGPGVGALPLVGTVPGLSPSSLGSATFRAAWGTSLPLVLRSADPDLVLSLASDGLLALLDPGEAQPDEANRFAARGRRVEGPWGYTVRPSWGDQDQEERVVDRLLEHGVGRLCARAYVEPSAPLVCYRLSGLHTGPDGRAVCPNRLLAVVDSREVAATLLGPPPEALVAELRRWGALSDEQVALASEVSMVSDLALTRLELLAEVVDLRRRLGGASGVRIGVVEAGSPRSLWAALAAGAAFVVVDAPVVEPSARIQAWLDEVGYLARITVARCQGLPVPGG